MTRECRRQEKHGHSFFFFPSSQPCPLFSLSFPVLSTSAVGGWLAVGWRYTDACACSPFSLLALYPRSTAIARETGYSARNPPPFKTADCFPRPQLDVTTGEQPSFPTRDKIPHLLGMYLYPLPIYLVVIAHVATVDTIVARVYD